MSSRTAISRRRAPARLLCAALIALVVAAGAPGFALAHAVLVHTTPHQNASLQRAPREIRLEFNEPVEVVFGAVRVFDSEGLRVDRGRVSHPLGDESSVAIGLRGGLGRGIYTATYRVISADGHPVSGGFSFGVGQEVVIGPGRGAPNVAELLARSDAGAAVEGAYGVVRGVHYAALLLLIGAIFFGLFVRPAGEPRWPRRLLACVAAFGLLAAVAGVLLQGALASGVSITGAFDRALIDGSLSTRTGETWLARACAWLTALGFVLLLPRRPSRASLLTLALPAAVLVGSLVYGGHAYTQRPRAVLIPADVLHMLAAGAWLGGLVLLLVLFWRDAGEPSSDATEATARFSRLALPTVAVLAGVGAVQAWFYVGSPGRLFTTTYGLALVAKIVLLLGIVVLAAGNRRRLAVLASTVAAPQALRRAMRAEVLLAGLVLAATATLVRAAPPAAVAAGPVVRELDLGTLRLQLDVEPARVGPNDLHLYLFDRRTGAQIDRVEEITVRLTQPDRDIGPIVLNIPRKGPAHYELLAQAFGVPGNWRAQVDVRISKFDQLSAETEFRVR